MNLWNNNTEIQFFTEAFKSFATPEQLFYNLQKGYFAYVPKGSDAEGQTLQSRNSLIGQFTEKWCKTLFDFQKQGLQNVLKGLWLYYNYSGPQNSDSVISYN